MTVGPGKYDDLCTYVRKKTKAGGAIVVIVDGNKGHGFSCQTDDPKLLLALPYMLEELARSMRADNEILLKDRK